MDPYAVNMMLGAYVAAHISLLHASMITHAYDPFSEFHNITVHVCRLLWSLPTADSRVKFSVRYHHLMMMGNPSWEGPRFQVHGAWATTTSELMLHEEFEQMGITIETLLYIFPLHQAHPPPAPPVLAQGAPSPLASGTL